MILSFQGKAEVFDIVGEKPLFQEASHAIDDDNDYSTVVSIFYLFVRQFPYRFCSSVFTDESIKKGGPRILTIFV